MQHLNSPLPQGPIYVEGIDSFHGNLKRKRSGERVLPEAERERRRSRWYANHATPLAVSCAMSWPPIDLDGIIMSGRMSLEELGAWPIDPAPVQRCTEEARASSQAARSL